VEETVGESRIQRKISRVEGQRKAFIAKVVFLQVNPPLPTTQYI
jgi:hypothetical protein